jgi:hypothetical protein
MTKTAEEISTCSLYNLLISIVAGETTLPRKTLSRQSSLSDYTDISLGISKTSLNTLKSRANAFIPGGFQELDKQRRNALACMQKRTAINKSNTNRSKLDLTQKITSLKKDISTLEEDLLTLSVALERALSRSTHYITDTNNQISIEQWNRERQEILSTLSLRNRFRQLDKFP